MSSGLERDIDNISTELKVRKGVQAAKSLLEGSESKKPDSRAPDDAGSTGGVGTVDELEALEEHVQEVEQQLKGAVAANETQEFHIQDLDDRVRVLETRLAPPSSNFSLLEMSNALAEQFTLIKDDHNGLDKAIKSQAKA
ncbi:hypothetical protein B0H13DRAFT_1925143 [Mycena leptocephala]|nr:hypothetical protein B0H13DRAFT_1925143 [Mycena leptocephala]